MQVSPCTTSRKSKVDRLPYLPAPKKLNVQVCSQPRHAVYCSNHLAFVAGTEEIVQSS